jgi:hypothetical protein
VDSGVRSHLLSPFIDRFLDHCRFLFGFDGYQELFLWLEQVQRGSRRSVRTELFPYTFLLSLKY